MGEKKTNFDVSMGSGDGAEICELIDLFIIYQITEVEKLIPKEKIGAFRDDYLAITGKSKRENEKLKKDLIKLFRKYKLEIEIELNITTVDYLDVTMDLVNGHYKPYCKPNAKNVYVNRNSNHWERTLKQIPIGVENRLNGISATKEDFDQNKHIYQDALKKAGYDHVLKWNENRNDKKVKKKPRKKHILYYNPPFSLSIKTKLGKVFINLVKKWFCNNPTLKSGFNLSTLKVSYSTCQNISQKIKMHNAKILKSDNENNMMPCNCRVSNECPLPGSNLGENCRTQNVVYEAKITDNNGNENIYIGGTSQEIKSRISFHKSCTRHAHLRNSCELAKKVHELTKNGKTFTIRWQIKEKSKSFRPGDSTCRLCISEMYHILYDERNNVLNKIKLAPCLHRKKYLLEDAT